MGPRFSISCVEFKNYWVPILPLGLRGVHTFLFKLTSALVTLHFPSLSLSLSLSPFLINNMASGTSAPRLIPERGQVLKRVLKMVFSCFMCAGSSNSHHPKNITSSSVFPAPSRIWICSCIDLWPLVKLDTAFVQQQCCSPPRSTWVSKATEPVNLNIVFNINFVCHLCCNNFCLL